MVNSEFTDPEKAHKFHAQKLEEMKRIMSKIVENPESVKVTDIQKVIDFSDQSTSNSVTDQ